MKRHISGHLSKWQHHRLPLPSPHTNRNLMNLMVFLVSQKTDKGVTQPKGQSYSMADSPRPDTSEILPRALSTLACSSPCVRYILTFSCLYYYHLLSHPPFFFFIASPLLSLSSSSFSFFGVFFSCSPSLAHPHSLQLLFYATLTYFSLHLLFLNTLTLLSCLSDVQLVLSVPRHCRLVLATLTSLLCFALPA